MNKYPESHFILRLPEEQAAVLRRRLRDPKDELSDVAMLLENKRYGAFKMGEYERPIMVMDLPTVVEVQRRVSGSDLYKSGELNKVLVVDPDQETIDQVRRMSTNLPNTPRDIDVSRKEGRFVLNSGLTKAAESILLRRATYRDYDDSDLSIQDSYRTYSESSQKRKKRPFRFVAKRLRERIVEEESESEEEFLELQNEQTEPQTVPESEVQVIEVSHEEAPIQTQETFPVQIQEPLVPDVQKLESKREEIKDLLSSMEMEKRKKDLVSRIEELDRTISKTKNRLMIGRFEKDRDALIKELESLQ